MGKVTDDRAITSGDTDTKPMNSFFVFHLLLAINFVICLLSRLPVAAAAAAAAVSAGATRSSFTVLGPVLCTGGRV